MCVYVHITLTPTNPALTQSPTPTLDPNQQDFTHVLEYRAMYENRIPRNNNWGFYLYKTAVERQERIRSYMEDTGWCQLEGNCHHFCY